MDLQRFGAKLHICLSQLPCVDVTQHCTMPWLLSCPLVNQENKRILGFSPPQPAYCSWFSWKLLKFLCLVWGLEATRVNPLIKELHFSLDMSNYTLNKKSKQSQEPLQGMLFGPCNPCRREGFLHRLQRWDHVCLGSFLPPQMDFWSARAALHSPGYWLQEEFCNIFGQDSTFTGHRELRYRVQGGMDVWTKMSLEGKSCKIPQKRDFGHNLGFKNRQNLIRNGSWQVIREVGPNISMQKKSVRPSQIGSFP